MQTAATSKDGRTAKGTEVINKNQRESIPAIAKKVTQEGTQLNIERIANDVPVTLFKGQPHQYESVFQTVLHEGKTDSRISVLFYVFLAVT